MKMTRHLTQKEIEYIIDFIKPQQGIPPDSALSIVRNNKARLRIQLKSQLVHPEIIPQLKEQLELTYHQSLIQPGESVGIICAQSLGEKNTQLTLNSFHHAGQSEKAITAGVPRFQELLNATKTPKLVSCKVFFKHGNDTIQQLRNTIGHSIVGLTLKDMCTKMTSIIDKEDEPWYGSFKILYNNDFTKYKNCISINFNTDILFEYKLSMKEIADIINNEYDDLSCVFSSSNIGQMDVFVDTSTIELPENRCEYIDTDEAVEIYLEEVVQPVLEKLHICGITGISGVYYAKESDEWMLETDGSNFKKILAHPAVDMGRVVSNNIWEIYETLGIEAVREYLIEEYVNIMDGINICHAKLLVERMTFAGTISSISRYTMRKEEAGPFSRASFEESLDNFKNAAAHGEIEPTIGVSGSIMCGKRANIGTGMMDLRIDIARLPIPNLAKILEDDVRDITNIEPRYGSDNFGVEEEKEMVSENIQEFVDF